MVSKCILLFSLIATIVNAGLSPVHFVATSAKSNVFAPLRPTGVPPTVIGCNKVVMEPTYGVLEYTYKRGEGSQNGKCTFILQAPPNHRVNIVSVAFDLLDSTSEKEISEYTETSTIDLFNSDKLDEPMLTYYAAARERPGAFIQSSSCGQKMIVEISYRDNVDYATQHFHITYEFLDADKMKSLLLAA